MTVDVFKADCEIKWLIGCTEAKAALALATHRTEWQAAMPIHRANPVER